MGKSNQIQYFLGANSPQGFYSLYPELLAPEQASVIYILKGGPGCGKSTLMRQVAARAEEEGETVEYILCSGGPGSLDAVLLPGRRAALVDGTAPHGSGSEGRGPFTGQALLLTGIFDNFLKNPFTQGAFLFILIHNWDYFWILPKAP